MAIHVPEVSKIVDQIGDNNESLFIVQHPKAPAVSVTVLENETGKQVWPEIIFKEGEIWLGFMKTPAFDQYMVTVIG